MHQYFIPDGFWNSKSTPGGDFVSHEAVCVLNATQEAAHVSLTLYFEDREKLAGFGCEIPAERTLHIRMDKIKNKDGKPVPQDVPYAIVVESDVKITVQYTRVDTSAQALAIASTIV